MKVFIAQNGQEVAKFVTATGITGYVDTSIPLEALEGLKKKLEAKIASHQVQPQHEPDLDKSPAASPKML